MALPEETVDWLTGQVTTISLADGPTAADEITGITPQSATYDPAVSGEADINNGPLEFSGPADAAVTHLIWRNSSGVMAIGPLDTASAFNSDGRFDVTSAPISNSIV